MKAHIKITLAAAISAFVFSTGTAFAETENNIFTLAHSEKEIEETIDEETYLETDEEKAAIAAKSRIGGRNISAFSRALGQTSVGGYFDTEYYFPQGKNSFFDQHRLILQASSLFNERMFFNTEIEFEHGGLINAGTNDGELKIEQAFLDYKIEDWLILRAGAVLVPVGRLNVLHDSDYRDTTARPLFSTVIVPTTWMEPGAGFYGLFYPNEEWEINYEAYVTQGMIDGISDGQGLRRARPSLKTDNNAGKGLTGRFGFSPFIGLDFGLGGYYSHYDAQSQKAVALGVVDFSYTTGPFELLGEAGYTVFDPVTLKDSEGKETGSLTGPMWGYYIEGHYHLFPDFLKMSFLGKGFDNPVFTLFGRVDQVDTNMSQLNANDRTQLTLGFNYRPIASTAFKFEYQWNLENEAFLGGDPSKEIANNQFVASVAVGF